MMPQKLNFQDFFHIQLPDLLSDPESSACNLHQNLSLAYTIWPCAKLFSEFLFSSYLPTHPSFVSGKRPKIDQANRFPSFPQNFYNALLVLKKENLEIHKCLSSKIFGIGSNGTKITQPQTLKILDFGCGKFPILSILLKKILNFKKIFHRQPRFSRKSKI